MVLTSLDVGSESYSVRECRCGSAMTRVIASESRYAWYCTSCGRQTRR